MAAAAFLIVLSGVIQGVQLAAAQIPAATDAAAAAAGDGVTRRSTGYYSGDGSQSHRYSHPACSSRPVSSSQLPPGLTACKLLIIGGGPGGLFSAWMLRDLGSQLCVVEKKDEWGGKMQGTNPPTPTPGADPAADPRALGSCGLRINEVFRDMRCLAHKLGVASEESVYDTLLYTRNTWSRSMQSFLGSDGGGNGPNLFGLKPANPDSEDLELDMLEYAFVATAGINPVTGKSPSPHPSANCAAYATTAGYLLELYGQQGFDFLMAGNSFRFDWSLLGTSIDLCAYIDYNRVDWERPSNNFYPVGGFRPLYKSLRQRIEAAGVRLFSSSPVVCLADVQPKRRPNGSPTAARFLATTASGAGWTAERLILAAGPTDVANMRGSLAAKLAASPVLSSIVPVRVAFYQAFWPVRWWDVYATKKHRNFRLVTPSDSRCLVRSEFPGTSSPASVNGSRPLYTDDPVCVEKWQKLFAKGGLPAVRSEVLASLRSLFPKASIPPPTGDAFYLPSNAWHYLRAGSALNGINHEAVAAWALQPLAPASSSSPSDGRVCMVGEAYYPNGSGWSWGAWQSALACAKNTNADLLNPERKAELSFIESGCGGHNGYFSTEVAAPPAEPLPGLNPSTGQPMRRQATVAAASASGALAQQAEDKEARRP